MGKKYDDDDNLTEEMMLDIWDGLKEEPSIPQKNYPAKKKKKSDKKTKAEKKRYRIHYRFDGMDISEIQEAYSADQAVTIFCKFSDSWYVKKEIKNKTRGFWVEEVKEEDEKGMKKELSLKDWEKYEAVEAECFGKNHYPTKGKGMTIVISSGYMSIHLALKNKYTLSIIDDTEWRENHGEPISVTYEIDENVAAYLNFEVFSGINIFTKCRMPESFGYYVSCVKETLQAAGIIDKNDKEEQKMKEDKINLDELVMAANAQAEQAEVEEIVEENNNNNEEETIMKNEENKEIKQIAEEQIVEQAQEQAQEPIIIENVIPTAEITLETIAGNMKQLNIALMAENEKRGVIRAIRVTDGELENIGSYVIGGGYAFPLFRISSKWFKKVSLSVNRKVDTTNRTIRFSGSKNYMSLLKLMFTDEEIEAAKAAEISRRFPAICERSESRGVPKNIAVTVALPDGSNLKLDGWVQREHRPLYMENSDRTITVRWDFSKNYADPSIKFLGKTLRKNHDGISGNPDDAKVFEIIKSAILSELNKA